MPSKLYHSLIFRSSVWKANNLQCFYCSEPVSFQDLEIDHIIPASVEAHELAQSISVLGLPVDFNLDSQSNLVPTHHSCNKRKSNFTFDTVLLGYYLTLWRQKQQKITDEIKRSTHLRNKDLFLAELAAQLEGEAITENDVLKVLESYRSSLPQKTYAEDPLVITFGINLDDPLVIQQEKTDESTLEFWDRLEQELLILMRQHCGSEVTYTEGSSP